MIGKNQGRMPLRTAVQATLFLLICAAGSTFDAQAQTSPEIVDPKVLTYKSARSYDFGTFCISNIPPGTVTSVKGPDIAPDGDWREIELQVPQGAPARPRIHFLGGMRREAGFYTACRATAAAEVRRILEADILEGTVRFQILDPIASYGRAVQIAERNLDIVIGNIKADLSSIYGGRVQSSNIRFDVVNPAPFIANPGNLNNPDDNLLAGRLQLLSYLLTLEDAALYLPEASTALRATLQADRVEGATFLLEIPSGRLSLFKGVLSTTEVDLSTGGFVVGGAEFFAQAGKVAKVELIGHAEEGPPEMRLRTVTATFEKVEHPNVPRALLEPSEEVTIAAIKGPLRADLDAARMATAEAWDVRMPKALLSLGGNPQTPTVLGPGEMHLKRLTETSFEGTAQITTPEFPEAGEVLAGLAAQELKLNFSGEKTAPQLDGELKPTALGLHLLQLAGLEQTTVKFTGLAADRGFGLKFSWATSTSKGRFTFGDPNIAGVQIEGAVEDFRGAGTFWLGVSASLPRLEMDPGAFHLTASGAVVAGPLLFGSTTVHPALDAGLDLASEGGFSIAPQAVHGQLELTTNLLVLNAPDLSFDDPEVGQFRIDTPLRFDAGVTLGIELADLQTHLLEGKAVIERFGAESLGTEGVHLAGLEMTAARLDVERLEIEAHGGDGSVVVQGLEFEAEKIHHAADPQWEVTKLQPKIAEVTATLGRAGKSLVLENETVHGLKLTAHKGTYRSPDGLDIAGQTFTVEADRLSEEMIHGGEIRIEKGALDLDVREQGTRTKGSTRFQKFKIEANGPKDNLSGRGRLELRGLEVEHRFPILKDKCKDKLQLRAALGIDEADLDLTLAKGELSGGVVVKKLAFQVRHTDQDSCTWDESFDVMELISEEACKGTGLPIPGVANLPQLRPRALQAQFPPPIKIAPPSLPPRPDELIPRPNGGDACEKLAEVKVHFKAEIFRVHLSASAGEVKVALRGDQGVGLCIRDARLGRETPKILVTPVPQSRSDLMDKVREAHKDALKDHLNLLADAFEGLRSDFADLASQMFPVSYCGDL